MIKRTRMKFTVIIACALIALLAALLINLNLTMDHAKARNVNETLDALAQNYNKTIANKIGKKSEFIVIELDLGNTISGVVYGQESLSKKALSDLKDGVLSLNVKRGDYENYKFLIQKKDQGHTVILVDTSTENLMLKALKDGSIKIAVGGFVTIILLAYGFSILVTQPLEAAMKKQKTFVADASHELKTPLSILKINCDLLKGDCQEGEYLKEIHMQVDRMSDLVNDLLSLAKLENHKALIDFEEFDLSKSILYGLLQLEVVAFENNRVIKYKLEDKLLYRGVKKDMQTMVDALVDNAIKYSLEGSDILVDLRLKDKHRVLTISNQSLEVSPEDCLNIFDGFYRMDQSRSQHSAGAGIGLSMVKNIAIKHGGTAEATYRQGLFTVKIKL